MNERNTADAIGAVVRQIEGDDSLLGRVRRVVRLALPLNAVIAVPPTSDDRFLEIGGERVFALPGPINEDARGWLESEGIEEQLEDARGKGAQYLLVPENAATPLHQMLRKNLASKYRVVLDEPGTCAVFAINPNEDPPFTGLSGPDGLPLPPPELVRLTAGVFENFQVYERFFEGGAEAVDSISSTLHRNGLSASDFEAMLEFGCGCARVLRQWAQVTEANLHGTDYNPYLIAWCRANLPIGNFSVNGIAPPLEYEAESFDFVYAISVFTHLIETLQIPWASELARVIKPGGYACITVNGSHWVNELPSEEARRLNAGELVERSTDRAGTNKCTVFHPEQYVREVLAPEAGLEVIDLWPELVTSAKQDAVLLRKL